MRQFVLLVLLVFITLFFEGCSSSSKMTTIDCPTFDGARIRPEKKMKMYAKHQKAIKKARRYTTASSISARRRPKKSNRKVKIKTTLRDY